MQFKDNKELPSLSQKDLISELNQVNNLLNNLMFNKHQGNLKDTSQLAKARAYRARLRGIESQRRNEDRLKKKMENLEKAAAPAKKAEETKKAA